MTADSIVFWLFVVAWIVVAGVFIFMLVPRIVREAHRIITRISALINGSPVPFALAKAEGDANRLNAALDRLPALQTRAEAAVEEIRTTEIVPPAIAQLVERVQLEIRAFKREAG